MARKNALVIGSGVAGLASAIRLAAKGYGVHVFESAAGPGGKLTELQLGPYRFDRGPSLFTRPDLVEELFTLAGRPMSGRFAYSRLDEANRYFWEDGTRLTGWSDPDRFAHEVERRLGVPGSRVRRHLHRADRLLGTTGRIFLEHSLHRPLDLLRGGFLPALLNVRPSELMRPLHDVNRSAFADARAVQLFDRFATYNGSDPFRTPGLMRMIPGLEHGDGAFYPHGGMYAITKALHLLAVDLGVHFHFTTRVERILLDTERRRVLGVRAAGADHRSDLVICNMDVVPAYRHLLPDVKAPERTLAQERSSSALVFYWGVGADHPELGLHNILFSKDHRSEFDHLFRRLSLCMDPTVYINITSKRSPGDAPQGHANWFTMINAPRDEGQYSDAIIDAARSTVMAKVKRTLGIDMGPLIMQEEVLDPRGIAARTGSHQGSLYGAGSNSALSAFLRHPNFHSRLKGLHFCGGSVHPGGGIPLALLSARIMADMIPAAIHHNSPVPA